MTSARDRQSVAGDELSLKTAHASVAAKQAPPTAAALTAARSSVVNAQIGVVNAQKAVSDTILRAPIAGTVAAVSGVVGTAESGGGNASVASSSSSSSGTGSGGSTGFVTLTGLTGMQLVAPFAETDTAKLRVGQAATVTIDALPTTELAAHIIAIDGTATSSSGVVAYNVTFALDRTEPEAQARHVGERRASRRRARQRPRRSVRRRTRERSNARVTVVANGKQTTTPVVAGLKGDTSTEIVSGVEGGQQVVTVDR